MKILLHDFIPAFGTMYYYIYIFLLFCILRRVQFTTITIRFTDYKVEAVKAFMGK